MTVIQEPASEATLASLLNILWRRRLLVILPPVFGLLVGVLYGLFGTRRWEATATVRPGITAFSPDGGPYRQWQLKDITKYYENMLYRRELVKRLDLPSAARPVIKADFVAQGLQNLQGGDVVTLSTTAASPEMATATLDTGITLFMEFAERDTLSSELNLTRDGLELQIENLETQIAGLEQDTDNAALRLEAAIADSAQIEAQAKQLDIDLAMATAQQARCENQLEVLTDQEPRLANDLDSLKDALARVQNEGSNARDAEIPAWVKRDAVLDRSDLQHNLVLAKVTVEQALWRNQSRQDSFALEIKRLGFQQERLGIDRTTVIAAKRSDAHRKIGELKAQIRVELPMKRRDLKTEIRGRLVKLGTLAPLQRVGTTIVSSKPVRPRPLRAITILVFLGIFGGLVLAFGWDYVDRHRREIFHD